MVDAFMAKPVKPSALLDTIMLAYGKQVVKRKRSLGMTTGPEDLEGIRGARVLIVDDSDINLQIACELLQKVPLVLDTASNGEEAVAMIRRKRYDCVLMDIQMPGMDGYTATAMIREDPQFDKLPVLAMTANVMSEDRARTREAGMNGHVAKPVDPSELYKALLDAIPEGDYSVNLPEAEDEARTGGAEVEPLPESLPGLEIRQGLGRLGNNETLYMQLLGDMVNAYAGAADDIRAFVAAGDPGELRGAAHKLRGIANNLGAADVGAAAEAIEQEAINGAAVTEEQLAVLGNAMDTVILSHATLVQQRRSAEPVHRDYRINELEVFASLRAAVGSFDPGASGLVDELIAAQDDGSNLVEPLTQVRELLNDFNFADTGPLLDEIEQALQG